MSIGIQAKWEPIRSLAAAAIPAATFAAGQVGTPLAFATAILWLDNLTNGTVLVSFDGVNANLVLPGNSGKVIDISGNRECPANILNIQVGTQIWVQFPVAPGAPTGSFYVSTMYQNPV